MHSPRCKIYMLPAVFLVVILMLGVHPAMAQVTAPTNLRVEGQGTPRQVTTMRPHFSWSASGQYSFQIQVHKMNVNWDCPWFWDSGEIVSSNNSVDFPSGSANGSCGPNGLGTPGQDLNRSGHRTFWRVRVKQSSSGSFSPWSESWFEINNFPSMAGNMDVSTGSGNGSNLIGTRTTGATRQVGPGQTHSTIQSAVNASSCGDTVQVHQSTYNEAVRIPLRCGVNNPFTIRNHPGDSPTISYTGGTQVRFDAARHIVLEGLHFTGSASRYGVEVADGSSDIMLTGLYFENSFAVGSQSVLRIRGDRVTLQKSRIYSSGGTAYAGVDVTGGTQLTFDGNDFSGSIDRSIAFHGGRERGTHLLINNYFHDIATTWPVIIDNYYGANNIRIERNVIICPPGGQMIRVQRVGLAYVSNNIFKGGGPVFNNTDAGSYYTVRNNIFMDTGTVFDVIQSAPASEKCQMYGADGDPAGGSWDIDYNLYFNVDAIEDADVAPCVSRGANECDSDTACNPYLDSDGDGTYNELIDFHPTANSARLRNTGDPGTPVPVSGGSTVDIGRFEYGAEDIAVNDDYAYQAMKTVASTTPRITWSFHDCDNDRSGSTISSQGRYRVWIDTVRSFDSGGPGRPLVDSGEITSQEGRYDVPAGILEDGNLYYVRVVLSDQMEPNLFGTLSDPRWAFRVDVSGSGNTAPQVPQISIVDGITANEAALHSSPFQDQDGGDSHASSEWQVDLSVGTFADPVSSGTTGAGVLRWTATGLQAATTYRSRVRHRDSAGSWSGWSNPDSNPAATFTTSSTPTTNPGDVTGVRRTDSK